MRSRLNHYAYTNVFSLPMGPANQAAHFQSINQTYRPYSAPLLTLAEDTIRAGEHTVLVVETADCPA